MSLKIVRRLLVGLVATLATLLLVILAVVNLVLTNDRLQPIIHSLADDYLTGELHIGNIEGTFFRSFPRIGVRLQDTYVVTNAFFTDSLGNVNIVDSLRSKKDTLVQFNEAIVGLDLMEYLTGDGTIALGFVKIEKPTVRLGVDRQGRYSWDVVRSSDADTLDADADTTSTSIILRHLRINQARITYYDQQQLLGFFVDSLELKADGEVSLDTLDIELSLSTQKTIFSYDDVQYIKRLPLAVDGHIYYNDADSKIVIEETRVTIANTDLDVDGVVLMDSLGCDVDIEYHLNSPSAEKLFAAIPTAVISTPVTVKSGNVNLKGTILGRADDVSMPVISGEATIDSIRAHYEGRPEEIEDITASFDLLIDNAKPNDSYANLDLFHFKGGKSEVEATVRLTQLLSLPILDCNVVAHVDLLDMRRVLPLDNIDMSGVVDADINARFRLQDLFDQNYGRISAKGSLTVDSLNILNDTTGLDILLNANVDITNADGVELQSSCPMFRLKTDDIMLFVRDSNVRAKTKILKDTTIVAPVQIDTYLGGAFFRTDSVRVFAKNIKLRDCIEAWPEDNHRPMTRHSLEIDTIIGKTFGIKSFTNGFGISATMTPAEDTTWYATGKVTTTHVHVSAPFYRLPFTADNIQGSFAGQDVDLQTATFGVGQTTITTSAHVGNFFKALQGRNPFSLDITVDADTINFNQLMAAVVSDTQADTLATDSTSTATTTADLSLDTDTTLAVATQDTLFVETEQMVDSHMIRVPRHVTLNITATAGYVVWDQLHITNVRSNIKTQSGAVHMTNFSFKMGDARALTTLAYKCWPSLGRAKVNLFTVWSGVSIEELINVFGVDSIIPALKPMSGKIDCLMGAEMELDSVMNVNLSTVKASVHLGGQNITVLDNDQFKKIAKMLLFKNKERNIIDTLSTNILIDDGKIQVLPFAISMDRYRMAVGGSQDFDMNMDYHVSILKSPLPFKAGVNIKGNPDDFSVGITTAKLKKAVTDDALAVNDSLAQLMRDIVLRDSYTLSGVEMPAFLKERLANVPENTSFAVDIQTIEDSEEAQREARRALELVEQGADPDSITATTDTTAQQSVVAIDEATDDEG